MNGERRRAITYVTTLFAGELDAFPTIQRAAAIAGAHTVTLFETWDNLANRHHIDRDSIIDTMRRALNAALTR